MARRENTIAATAQLAGRGLFSGREVQVRLRPAEAGTGLLLVRTDLPDSPVVPATPDAAASDFHYTVLRRDEVEVRSVEHLLSACFALKVDNLMVEVDAEEMPACGGCALPYAEALRKAGIRQQTPQKRVGRIAEPVAISQGDASISAMPAEEGLTLTYVLQFDDTPQQAATSERRTQGSNPKGHQTDGAATETGQRQRRGRTAEDGALAGALAPQVVTCRIDPERYFETLAPARTFATERAYEEFATRGAGSGVTDDNALVVFHDGSVRKPLSRQPANLRFPDECARHKLVDLLGDLSLAGLDLQGKIVAVRSGHQLNVAMAARLREVLTEAKPALEQLLDIREIQRVLPHRYPFLLVDRILRMEGDNRIVGLKNVSLNEHFFQGHFPDYPIMPGVLQLEALAQVAGVLLLQKLEHTGKLALMVSMDAVKLRRPVVPGDQLILEATAVRVRSRTAQINARATVEGEVSCEAEMRFMMVSPEVL